MKKYVASFVLVVVVLLACSKDNFETKPKLEITGYNTKEVRPIPGSSDAGVEITMNYFDKEGDLQDGSFLVLIKRLNQRPAGSAFIKDSFYRKPFQPTDGTLPDRDKGSLTFRLPYNLMEYSAENDTLQFRFAITDRAGNTSDTVTADPIVRIN